ncbi:MAG: Fic family protein [Desulfovibrio sp.]|uniref:Fic/DOC family protein n=1 Tax=Desulfovibrio sp. TaxID=885 RepID=UPI00258A72FB|nr:Fic family protein [Desulfovibrio sp.]MCD7983088.1 Fic family protein [Desulfovibrio sp.]
MLPGSTTLKNIPGIRDAEQLAAFERNAVAWRSLSIPTGRYDITHLKAIHKHLFQDVYEWAGAFRTIPMAKGASRFAQPQYIEQETRKILGRIAQAAMRTIPVGPFAAALADMLSELNAVHPFREGNGRAIRAFSLLLAEECGYAFDISAITPTQWTDASILAFQGDNSSLESLLRNALSPLPAA